MSFKIDIRFTISYIKTNFINTTKNIILGFSIFLLIFSFIFNINVDVLDAAVLKNDKLLQRISKDYTNKYCNSIAFGLSKDSAMAFASKENNMIFKTKKGIENLSLEKRANEIAVLVIDTCGYNINLKGQEGIDQFANDYILINSSISIDK